MDWLSRFSPMVVDWKQKWLKIAYGESSRVLQGELQELPLGTVIQVTHMLMILLHRMLVCHWKSFSSFKSSSQCLILLKATLPSESVNMTYLCYLEPRPCRYDPIAIHQQLRMKSSGRLPRCSVRALCSIVSPFSSSVLLVKKKDRTFRFCVDFRQLNAITVKTKYPVLVIEELLDELHGAPWFTSLDLAAGYYQIRLKPGEEAKTAFQTHTGHYEF